MFLLSFFNLIDMWRAVYICFLIIIIAFCQAYSANLYSISNGSWSGTTTWSYTPGGASCGCSPIASDNVTINHTIAMDKHLTNVGSSLNGITGILTINFGGSLLGGNTYDIDIRSTGQLYLCGTLTARDAVFSNGSIVHVCSTGVLNISRDFQNKNNSDNVFIDGSMTVGGSYTNGNGGLIGGTGTISITNGPVSNIGNTYGCTGFDPCAGVYPCQVLSPCGQATLPVNLLAFDAKWNTENTVLINWITSSEVNNDFFNVQRSTDAKVFISIGKINGQGSSSATHHYSLVDHELDPAENIYYYRLMQVNFDKSFSLSGIVAVARNRREQNVSIYPNPVSKDKNSTLQINFLNVPEAELNILDISGKLILTQSETSLPESCVRTIPLRELSQGVYFLKITTPFTIHAYKLIVYD